MCLLFSVVNGSIIFFQQISKFQISAMWFSKVGFDAAEENILQHNMQKIPLIGFKN